MNGEPAFNRQCRVVLQQSGLFRRVPDALLDEILSGFRRDTWRRNTQLDPASFQERFFVLIQGRVEVSRVNPQTGRSITLQVLGPGDGIDVLTLLTGELHAIQPMALDDVTLASAPVGEVRSWIERHPEFNRHFLPYLGEQMRLMEDLATDLALYDTLTRLARLLLRHVAHGQPSAAPESPHGLRLIHDLHDETLARMVGSVRQVVNRHLQHWRKSGVIHKHKFRTEIEDLEALQSYAEGVAPADKPARNKPRAS